MIRAGLSQTVAKQISGHKSDDVFERYNIVETSDIRDAMEKLGEYVKIQAS